MMYRCSLPGTIVSSNHCPNQKSAAPKPQCSAPTPMGETRTPTCQDTHPSVPLAGWKACVTASLRNIVGCCRAWLFPLLLLLLAALVTGCGPQNSSHHVELVADTDSPTPAMTFELRFDSAMVKGDRVGLPETNSPLIINPPLVGTFTWLSPRSGVFAPGEPLGLAARYQLSLRKGLRDAEGQPSAAALHWTIKTPAFGIIALGPHQTTTNASSRPEIKLAFNADVLAAETGRYLYFRNDAGNRIPAEVRQGTFRERWSCYEFGNLRTWKEDAAAMASRASKSAPPEAENPDNEAPNLLIVTPRHALSLGENWKLIIARGLPAADHSLSLREEGEVLIGDITPFVVDQVAAHHYLHNGASLEVDFSKPVPPSLTNRFSDWIELSDQPADLKVQVLGRQLLFKGGFNGGTEITLKLKPGFPAEEPFTLQGSNTFVVAMPHIAPRLYFPAFSRDQLAGGKRSFSLLTVNVAHVRVRAKLMDPATAVHALRGYRSYFILPGREPDDEGGEPYRAIDYNVLPGTTVFDQTIDLDPRESDESKQLNFNWDELLNGRRTGVVFLDAREVDGEKPPLGTQTLIQLTDLGMVWKKSKTGVDVFAFSQGTGRPVAGATARLMSDESQTLREAMTDTNGVAHLNASTNADWVAVQSGEDFHALPLNQNRVWQSQYDLASTGTDADEDPESPRRVLLFSDRDLYRPGETLHLEAIVRDWDSQGLHLPPGLTGTLQCTDARDKVFFQTNAVFNALGSWSVPVPLPTGSRGVYSARLYFGTNDELNCTNTYSFQVRDFQPSAFEITIAHQESYAAGERVELPLSARYLFGKALSKAQVAWSLEAEDTDVPAGKFPTFSFRRADFESHYGRGRSSLTLSGRETLAGTSNCLIAPNLSTNAAAPQPRAVSLLAEVTDVNQQTLSRRVDFICHSSDFYLGLRQGAEVLNSNTPPALEILALGADGKPWPEAVKAHLTLQRVDWQNVRVQGAGRTARFHNEAVFTNILEKDIAVAPVAEPGTNDEAKGNGITNLPALPAGEYLLEAKTADRGGRPVVCSLDFRVSALGETGWNYRNEVDLTLKPNRPEYAPGDTAELLVEAPFSGTALVTVERERVLRSFITQLDGNAPTIRVPLETNDVPNVFVSVTLLRGSDQSTHAVKEPAFRTGSCPLTVQDPRNRLLVELTPATTNHLPGQPVAVTAQVTDAAHQPVADAEVILYAVDDGILGLTGYTLPDPYGFFYAPRPLAVLTSISLPNLLTEDPDELHFANKGYFGGGGGREPLRKNFLACAFWNASLLTDARGQVQVRFTAPDSLTRYHLFAVVHTAGSRFGGGQSAFRVTKPLVIEPALPAFANVTDQLIARGVVLNQTTNAGEVVVTLELDDQATNSGPGLSRRIPIPANGSAVVEFPVTFTDTGEAKWVWRAHFADPAAGNFNDAAQSTIPVGHIAPLLGEVLLSRVITFQTNLLARANPQLLAGRGTVTVSVANTRLNELRETASQLLHYPYGCAEQTGSSLLPWILLRDARGLLPERAGPGTNDSAAAIRYGVARLVSMQTQSGGLGYWPRDQEPMLWASAYGGMVLAIARHHDVAVPGEEWDSLLKYLSGQLRSLDEDGANLSDGCLALYTLALAGQAEPAYQEKLYGLRGKLSTEDRALLALAIAESHGPNDMVADLLHDPGAHPVGAGHFDCAAREKAIRLLAWIACQPDDPTVDRLVTDLMHEQKEAHWLTTQGNAWGLLALTEYARKVEAKRPPASGELSCAGPTIPFQLDEQTNVFTRSFTFTNLADTALSLSSTSTACLYTTVAIAARPPETAQPRQDRGISLQRRYDRLDDDNQPRDLAGLRVGDRVLVTLRLGVREPAEYVAIDDALPATLEAVNPEFRTQEARSAGLADDEEWWVSDFREIHKDRCLWFANAVEPGNYVLRYVARVRAAGTVTAPPAKVEEMYHPEHCGLSGSQLLISEPLK